MSDMYEYDVWMICMNMYEYDIRLWYMIYKNTKIVDILGMSILKTI